MQLCCKSRLYVWNWLTAHWVTNPPLLRLCQYWWEFGRFSCWLMLQKPSDTGRKWFVNNVSYLVDLSALNLKLRKDYSTSYWMPEMSCSRWVTSCVVNRILHWKYKHKFFKTTQCFHCMLDSKMYFTSNYVLESNKVTEISIKRRFSMVKLLYSENQTSLHSYCFDFTNQAAKK